MSRMEAAKKQEGHSRQGEQFEQRPGGMNQFSARGGTSSLV